MKNPIDRLNLAPELASKDRRDFLSRRRLVGAAGLGAVGLAAERLAMPGSAFATSPTPDDEGWVNVKDTAFAGGAVGDGSADDTAAINAAIDYLNSNTRSVLFFPPGRYKVTSGLHALTGSNIRIVGSGPEITRIEEVNGGTFGGLGTFFTIGATGSSPSFVAISDMTLTCLDTPPSDFNNAFVLKDCSSVYVDRIHVLGIAGLCKVGDPGIRASNVFFSRIDGSFDGSLGGRLVWIRNGNRLYFTQVHISTATVTNHTGAGVFADPQDNCDTVWFDECALWGGDPGTDTAGKNYGIYADFTDGNMFNWWFHDCIFDQTNTAGLKLISASGTSDTSGSRYIIFEGTHFATQSGNCVLITNPSSDILEGVDFVECTLRYSDAPAASVSGANTKSVRFLGCNIVDHDSTTTKGAALSFATSNFVVVGNTFRSTQLGATGTQYAVETTAASVDRFVVADNLTDGLSSGIINHASYTTPSDDRIVRNNVGQNLNPSVASAATVTLPEDVPLVTVTGTTTITTINASWAGRIVTLKFNGASGLTDGSNLRLAGNFGATADDTITLCCNGTNWFEIARSVN